MGKGFSWWFLNNSRASTVAILRAQDSLARKLDQDVDPVRCPDCGWLQADMVRHLRRGRCRWLQWAALLPAVLTLAVLMIHTADAKGEDAVSDGTFLTVAASAVAYAACALLLRMFLVARYAPNDVDLSKAVPIPGAPLALPDVDLPPPAPDAEHEYPR